MVLTQTDQHFHNPCQERMHGIVRPFGARNPAPIYLNESYVDLNVAQTVPVVISHPGMLHPFLPRKGNAEGI